MAIARAALAEARRRFVDFVILDTAGRLHVDDEMMREASATPRRRVPGRDPVVADAMTGQDAVNVARAFDEALSLTGVVLTKADGDSRWRGRALGALGDRQAGEVPRKPARSSTRWKRSMRTDRVRILGMGDVLTLIEEAERKVDRDKAEKFARKMGAGKRFDLEDLRDQVRQMREMGGMRTVMDRLPGMAQLPSGAMDRVDERGFVRTEAVINSMTPHERRQPQVIRGSRKRRIAAGSGTTIQEVNRVLKQAEQMQKMMRRMRRKGGLSRMMGALDPDALPPDLLAGGAPGVVPGAGPGRAARRGGKRRRFS